MTFGQRFTDLHSSPKERQLHKSYVSIGEECNLALNAPGQMVYHFDCCGQLWV